MVPVFGRCHVTHRCHQRCVCIASVSIFCATWCLKTYETGTNQIPLKIWVQSNTFHIVPSWQKLMDEIVPIDFSTADAEWTCTTSIQNPGQEQRHSLLSEHSVSAFLGCDVNLVRIGRIDCTLSQPASLYTYQPYETCRGCPEWMYRGCSFGSFQRPGCLINRKTSASTTFECALCKTSTDHRLKGLNTNWIHRTCMGRLFHFHVHRSSRYKSQLAQRQSVGNPLTFRGLRCYK